MSPWNQCLFCFKIKRLRTCPELVTLNGSEKFLQDFTVEILKASKQTNKKPLPSWGPCFSTLALLQSARVRNGSASPSKLWPCSPAALPSVRSQANLHVAVAWGDQMDLVSECAHETHACEKEMATQSVPEGRSLLADAQSRTSLQGSAINSATPRLSTYDVSSDCPTPTLPL